MPPDHRLRCTTRFRTEPVACCYDRKPKQSRRKFPEVSGPEFRGTWRRGGMTVVLHSSRPLDAFPWTSLGPGMCIPADHRTQSRLNTRTRQHAPLEVTVVAFGQNGLWVADTSEIMPHDDRSRQYSRFVMAFPCVVVSAWRTGTSIESYRFSLASHNSINKRFQGSVLGTTG